MRTKIDFRDAYGDTVKELLLMHTDILAVMADSRGSSRLADYAMAKFPRVIDVGIAEQNAIGISAGLAVSGKIVFVAAIAPFIVLRALEQIRSLAAHCYLPIKIVGVSSGYAQPSLGATHTILEDVAIMRAIPRLRVHVPENYEAACSVLKHEANMPGPCYIRLGRTSPFSHISFNSKFCSHEVIEPLTKFNIVICGQILHMGLEVVQKLKRDQIQVGLLLVRTISPLDGLPLRDLLYASKLIITVEEHIVSGGLGSALVDSKCVSCEVIRFGAPSCFTKIGDRHNILESVGLTTESLYSTIKKALSTFDP